MMLRSLAPFLLLLALAPAGAGAQVLSKTGWTLLAADSEEQTSFDGSAGRAFDDDPATAWHTQLAGAAVDPPHEIAIDLGALFDLTALRYLPRAQEDGRIDLFEVAVSSDAALWIPVASGFFANGPQEQEVGFPETTGRYVRLRALREVSGNPWTAVAEIGLLGTPFGGNFAPDGAIDTPATGVTILVGDPVAFSGSGSDAEDAPGALTWLWEFGDPAIPDSTLEDPGAVSFDAPGTFTVSLTATDSGGRADASPATRTVRVLEPGTDPTLPKAAFSVVGADSEELVSLDGAAANAIDSDFATFWHTATTDPPPPPHDIRVDLGSSYVVDGFRVTPREDGSDAGRIAEFQLYVSEDGASWGGPVASGGFPNDPDEQARLTEPRAGRYVRLVALSEVNGGPFTSLAELEVEGFAQSPANGSAVIESRVAASSDDAEERPTGDMRLSSSDLELTFDKEDDQTIGLRFTGIDIPPGTPIQDAWVQFEVDETSSNPAPLLLHGQASDAAATFSSATGDLAARPRTAASVAWSPPPWLSRGEAGPDQRTGNLAPLIQEIVDRPGWVAGNPLVLIISGSGHRVAESWDKDPLGAALLHIEYETGPPVNQPPAVDAGGDQTIVLPSSSVGLDADVVDDGVSGSLTTSWSHVGGTGAGTVSFDDAGAVDTTAHFSADAGSYVLQLLADDGEFSVSDEIVISVAPEGSAPFTLASDDFDGGAGGFTYADDTFRGTSQPAYASGSHDPSGGQSGGALRVDLGGIDGVDVLGMSGGWSTSFSLAQPAEVTLSVAYRLDVAAAYEGDEYGEALVSLDGSLHGTPPGDYLARFSGGGSSGWQPFQVDLGLLSPGTYTVTLGGHSNKKTGASESTAIWFDDFEILGSTFGLVNSGPEVDAGADQSIVLPGDAALAGSMSDDGLPSPPGATSVTWSAQDGPGIVTFADPSDPGTTASFSVEGSYVLRLSADDGELQSFDECTVTVNPVGSGPIVLIDSDFDAGPDGFGYADDSFRGTSQPAYASGVHSPAGGQSAGGLRVDLGGIDGVDVLGMSGGWTRTFSLAQPADVTLSIAYRLDVSDSYEAQEHGEVLVAVDGVLHGVDPNDYVAQIAGGGSSGWQTFQVALGILSPGTHAITLGGYNNKKTTTSEASAIFFDDVQVLGSTYQLQNSAPSVAAGPDQTIVLPSDASLSGTLSDDGLPFPPGATSVTWTAQSGPGTVTFADPNTLDTTASFSVDGSYVLRLTADDGELQVYDELGVTADPVGSGPTVLVDSGFDAGPGGFGYADDSFRGTAEPAYASGAHEPTGGLAAGGLRVDLGGLDGADITGMSGGWSHSFPVSEPMRASVTFWHELVHSPSYDNGEFSQTLLAIDGQLHGIAPNDYVAQLANGAAGPGWQAAEVDVGILLPGTHTLTLGGYNNKKTSVPEQTTLRFDDVQVLGTTEGLVNSAPAVDAGADRSVVLPNLAPLDGVVSDDGLPYPPGGASAAWSVVSGPGSVTFTDPNAAQTTASFSISGTYVLRLVGDDGEFSDFDDVTLTAVDGGQSFTIEATVDSGSSDAEERSDGSMYVSSSDLEMVWDAGILQTVGIRFPLWVSQGALVTDAWIQFTVDEPSSDPTPLTIEIQDSDHAATFGAGAFDISSRPRAGSSVPWSPPAWLASDDSGAAQRTPDLSALIQEVVDRPGWLGGNHIALIITGGGQRIAHAYEGSPSEAPRLHVEYEGQAPNQPPAVFAGPNQGVILPDTSVSLDATVSDDGKPGPTVTTLWTHVGGTGTGSVSFADATAVDTTVSFSPDPGTYVLRLTADDGARSSFDEATILIYPSGGQAVSALVQVGEFETGIPGGSPLTIPAIDPAGITYHEPSGELFISDSEINEVSAAWSIARAQIFQTPPDGSTLTDDWDLRNSPSPFSDNKEPTGITWCASDDHFYVSNDDTRSIFRYELVGSSFEVVDEVSTVPFADDPEGLTCDPLTGLIYVVSGIGTKVLIYSYGAGGFALEDHYDLSDTAGSSSGIPSDPEGIAFDPVSGHLFIVSDPDEKIYEFTREGVYVDRFSIANLSPDVVSPQGLGIGTSSSDPNALSIYISDGGVDNDEDSTERDGRIYELEIVR